MLNNEQYLNEVEVSDLTGMSLSWLRKSRFMGTNIPYFKIGSSVRYRADDVANFMESHRVAVGA